MDPVYDLAIAIARVNEGDDHTIRVCPGDYTLVGELNTIEKTVDLILEPGVRTHGAALTIDGDGSTISGWQARGEDWSPLRVTGDDVTIMDVWVEETSSKVGGSWYTPIIEIDQAIGVLVTGIMAISTPYQAWTYSDYIQPLYMPSILNIYDSTGTIESLDVTGTLGGQAIYAYKSTLLLQDLHMHDAAGISGLITAFGSDLTISDSDFLGFPQTVFLHPVPRIGRLDEESLEGKTLFRNVMIDMLVDTTTYASSTHLVSVQGAEMLSFENVSISTGQGIIVDAVEELSITGSAFSGDIEIGTQPFFSVNNTQRLDIQGSRFCNFTGQTTAALSLFNSCGTGLCSIKGSVFDNTYTNSSGGAIYADRGSLLIERSTFRGVSTRSGSLIIEGEELSLTVDRTLVAESNAGPDERFAFGVIAPTITNSAFDTLAFDGTTPGDVKTDIAPVWFSAPTTPQLCSRSVLLADDPENRWLIENRVGAFSPCWFDGDGDGFGGERRDTDEECIEGWVDRGEDCDDTDPKKTPLEGCPIDADEDGVFQGEDCNDHNENVGKCAFGFSSGCDTLDRPIGALTLLFLLLCTRRTRTSTS